MEGIRIGNYTFIYERHFSPEKLPLKTTPVVTPAPIYDILFLLQNTISTVHEFCFIREARYPVVEYRFLYAPRSEIGQPVLIQIYKGRERYCANSISIYDTISPEYKNRFSDFIQLLRMWEFSGLIFAGFHYGAVVAYFRDDEQFQPQHTADHFVIANVPLSLPTTATKFCAHIILEDVKYMRKGGIIIAKPNRVLIGILNPHKKYFGDSYGDIEQVKCVECYTNRSGEVYIFPDVLRITHLDPYTGLKH